ncbi:hypothetical protein N9X61_01145, partial [Sulfurimonas sp.]|nr:hypothetical protein [Sulfurimonas sp.]
MIKISFIILLLIALNVNADVNWKYKDWEINSYGNDLFKASTNGLQIYGHDFGVIKRANNCNRDLLWLTFSSTMKGLKKYAGKEVELLIDIDDEKFKIGVDVSILDTTPTMEIALFSNFIVGNKFIKLLKKGKKIKVTIIKPEKIVNQFDIKSELFSLKGFTANYLKLNEYCQKKDNNNVPEKVQISVKHPLQLSSKEQKAVESIKKFCDDKGVMKACHTLGKVYSSKMFDNKKVAVEYFNKACNLGYQASCKILENEYPNDIDKHLSVTIKTYDNDSYVDKNPDTYSLNDDTHKDCLFPTADCDAKLRDNKTNKPVTHTFITYNDENKNKGIYQELEYIDGQFISIKVYYRTGNLET